VLIMSSDAGAAPLRLALLAVAVQHGVDLVHTDAGLVLGNCERAVPWPVIEQIAGVSLATATHEAMVLRLRLALPTLQAVLSDPEEASGRLQAAARPLALVPEHTLYPGSQWLRQPVPGDVLHLGIGLLSPPDWPGRIIPLPPALAAFADLDTDRWWPGLQRHGSAMAGAVAKRMRDRTSGILRPMGGCDVLTLLAAPELRRHLCQEDGVLRSVAVPNRQRGWFDLRHEDPAFISAAWSLTDPIDQGVPFGLLISPNAVARVVRP
jgi:hypothetical protein